MNYEQAVAYIEETPKFTKKNSLDHTRECLARLGNPQNHFKVIHVAGTNGKGSTCAFLTSILREAGYSCGLFTSPHLVEINERFQINEVNIDNDTFLAAFEKVKALADELEAEGSYHPTYFEMLFLMGMVIFAQAGVDYVTLETGLGGRLDATTSIKDPVACVITSISLDHMQYLGDTVAKIAGEKAGIIRPGVPVVSQSDDPNVQIILRSTALEKGCSFTDVSVLTDHYRKYPLAMTGDFQLKNAATAAEAVRAAGIEVTESDIASGLAKAFHPGRFEIIRENPYVIIDGGHNPDAIKGMCRSFTEFARQKKIKRTLLIFGCMRDKDSRRMVQLLTSDLRGVSYASVAIDYERAEDPETIAGYFADMGRSCTCYKCAEEAFKGAMASDFECILITGSIYLAGAMRGYFLSN